MAPVKMPTNTTVKPPTYFMNAEDGNLKRVRTAQTVSGILSTLCSLLVLYLYWKLRRKLFRGKSNSFMNLLVFAMTIFQTLQDISLSMELECMSRIGSSDDDFFWTGGGNAFSYKRCQRASWWLTEASGIMLQMTGLEMAVLVLLIIVYQRQLDYFKWTKYWLSFSAVVSIIGASLNAFGATNCKKKFSKAGVVRNSYDCPPTPEIGFQFQMSPGAKANYWSVNFVGWRFCEYLRTSVSFLSLILCLRALNEFWHTTLRSNKPTKVAVYRQLVNRIIWYPVAQSFTRFAAIYIIIFGSINNVDKPGFSDDLFNFRLFCAFMQSIFVPSGGVLMLVIFIRNNPAARSWFDEAVATVTNRHRNLDERETLNDNFRLSAMISDSSKRQGAQAEVEVEAEQRHIRQVYRRCSMMDEDELVEKVVANKYATEQEWSDAILTTRRGSGMKMSAGLRRSSSAAVDYNNSSSRSSIESGNFHRHARHSLKRPSSLSESPPLRRGSDSSSPLPHHNHNHQRASLSSAVDTGGRDRRSRSGSLSRDRRSRSGSLGPDLPPPVIEPREMRRFSFKVENPLVAPGESGRRNSCRL